MSRPPRPSTYASLVDDVCQQLKASVTTYSREHSLRWPPRGGDPVAIQTGKSDPTASAAGASGTERPDEPAYPDNRLMEKHLRRAASKVRYLERQAAELLDILTKGYDHDTGTYATQQQKAARTPDAVSQRELDAQLQLKQRREAS